MAKAIPHGTASGYSYHKCRCDECVAAKREESRRWRAANPDHNRQWRAANKERAAETHRRWVEQNRERSSQIKQRWADSNPEKLQESQRKWQDANRERVVENNKRWRDANREKMADYHRRYRKEDPEKYAERARQWREANPEKVLETTRRYREANPDASRLWAEANPERMAELNRIKNARRRARKRDAFVEDVPRFEIFERDNWECRILGCLYPGILVNPDASWPDPLSASVDHVIPLAKGGLHERVNLVCAHLHCNIVKRDRIEGIA